MPSSVHMSEEGNARFSQWCDALYGVPCEDNCGRHEGLKTQHMSHSIHDLTYSLQHTSHSIQDLTYKTQHSKHSMQDTAYKTQHARHSMQDTAYKIQQAEWQIVHLDVLDRQKVAGCIQQQSPVLESGCI